MKLLRGILSHWIGTTIHKFWVAWYVGKLIIKLVYRAIVHDFSKYGWTETKHFARTAHKLKKTEYGTEAYRTLLKEIQPALDHHYKVNRHHPEHWPHGIDDMSALDELEMICDWAAASKRHKGGSAILSVAINAKRFGYSFDKHKFYEKLLMDLSSRLMKKIEKKS